MCVRGEADRDVLVRNAGSQRLSKAAVISVCGAEGFMSAVHPITDPSCTHTIITGRVLLISEGGGGVVM